MTYISTQAGNIWANAVFSLSSLWCIQLSKYLLSTSMQGTVFHWLKSVNLKFWLLSFLSSLMANTDEPIPHAHMGWLNQSFALYFLPHYIVRGRIPFRSSPFPARHPLVKSTREAAGSEARWHNSQGSASQEMESVKKGSEWKGRRTKGEQSAHLLINLEKWFPHVAFLFWNAQGSFSLPLEWSTHFFQSPWQSASVVSCLFGHASWTCYLLCCQELII